MRRTIGILTAAVMALAIGACGGDDDGGGSAAERTDATPRSVVHAMGTSRITGTPERVVVLDTGELDSAVALGVKPVGAVEAIAGAGFPAYLADAAKGAKTVGTIEQPNIEAIAALKPDLILSSKLRHEAIYDQLSRIAPTVFSEEVGVAWKENFALHGRALGRADARRLQAEYERKARELGDALGAGRDRMAVSVLRSVGDEVRIYEKANFLGTILDDVGLPRPKAQADDEFATTATEERIPDLDGDVMFLSRFGDDHRLLGRLQDNRLWSRLRVVRAERVYEVPDDLWFLGIGNLAARRILDGLRTILVDGERLPGDDGNPATA
ncbi:MAG: ABC transporter substrate-binding protein [Solirubrobacteraceae bacterium]